MASPLLHFFPRNVAFSFETLRAVGGTASGSADLSEVIAISSCIPSGNEDKWLQEWRNAGDRAVSNAKTSLAAKNHISARSVFF